MDRRQLFDQRIVGSAGCGPTPDSRAAGTTMGSADSYLYVLRGRVTIEYGPTGRERVTAVAGDFIFNPARMVHREITAPDEPAELFVVRVGTGPQNVNVDGPNADPDSR